MGARIRVVLAMGVSRVRRSDELVRRGLTVDRDGVHLQVRATAEVTGSAPLEVEAEAAQALAGSVDQADPGAGQEPVRRGVVPQEDPGVKAGIPTVARLRVHRGADRGERASA